MAEKFNNKEILSEKGIKNTKQRNLMLDILVQYELPITAEQIFLKFKELDAAINLSTVYRILDVFVCKGLVLKSNIADDNIATYEINRMEHKHHLICISCKRVFIVDGCPLKEYEEILQKKMDFDVVSHKLEIYGYCHDCKIEC